ncbi:MAG: hypothetical protein JNK87_15295 [Bryobacterales bacterium]|nr:hypothetical protein [Bryobacterales bacterium]
MSPLVPLVMVAWVPLVLALFAFLPARRALLVALTGGWLFLPVATFHIEGWPDVDKLLLTSLPPLAAVFLWDRPRLLAFRPSWLDLPVLCFCLTPLATALLQHQGWHEALSAAFWQTVRWALPYLYGRLYFHDTDGLRALAHGIFLGGLVYVPLCLYEMVAGPDLHRMLYGFFPHNVLQAYRLGGWRPAVFQHMGIMTALWMTAASLAGLWAHRARPRIVAGLVLTTIAMRSVNAWGLLTFLSLPLALPARLRRLTLLLTCLLAIAVPVTLRITGLFSGQTLVRLLEPLSAEKAQSIRYRLENEDRAIANVRPRALFGLGRGDQVFVVPQWPRRLVLDSLWVLVYAQWGLAGLAGLCGTLLLPVVCFLRALPAPRWHDAVYEPAAALAVIVIAAMLDNLFNDMGSPIYTAAAGGLAAFSMALRRHPDPHPSEPRPPLHIPHIQQ